MPIYHFDVVDNGELTEDEVGAYLDSNQSARQEANNALSDLTNDTIDGRPRTIFMVVRQGNDTPLYKATVTFPFELFEE